MNEVRTILVDSIPRNCLDTLRGENSTCARVGQDYLYLLDFRYKYIYEFIITSYDVI